MLQVSRPTTLTTPLHRRQQKPSRVGTLSNSKRGRRTENKDLRSKQHVWIQQQDRRVSPTVFLQVQSVLEIRKSQWVKAVSIGCRFAYACTTTSEVKNILRSLPNCRYYKAQQSGGNVENAVVSIDFGTWTLRDAPNRLLGIEKA
jgi:hypothetical protein